MTRTTWTVAAKMTKASGLLKKDVDTDQLLPADVK